MEVYKFSELRIKHLASCTGSEIEVDGDREEVRVII